MNTKKVNRSVNKDSILKTTTVTRKHIRSLQLIREENKKACIMAVGRVNISINETDTECISHRIFEFVAHIATIMNINRTVL